MLCGKQMAGYEDQRINEWRFLMQRFFRLLLFWTLLLSGCTARSASPQPGPATTTSLPDPQNCGYQWAYQDLLKLSSSFQQSIQALQPEAQASAFAFGENCILSDGSIAGFSAMETDFNITLQVNDPADEAELGEWIVKVMQVIAQIPPEQIMGPRPGRVTMIFQSGSDQKALNFYIDQFQGLPAGLESAEIYRRLMQP
jgi:hypothetical protein